MSSSIHKLEENHSGKDYIIGDVHGNAHLLNEVIAQLTPKDRLFIVGDLFDRGGGEVDVYKTIFSHPNIYAVQGNHEDMLLKACSPHATETDIRSFLQNGGSWVLRDAFDRDALNKHMEHTGHNPYSLKDLFMASPKVPELQEITGYVQDLPYVIQVGSSGHAFNVCHADLPFSDHDLDVLSRSQMALPDKAKQHVMWAREKSANGPTFAKEGGRHPDSSVVYCGHNILETSDDAIRTATNHVNLDGGAYYSDCFILVNHTDQQAKLIYPQEQTHLDIDPLHQEAAKKITLHLHQNAKMSRVRKETQSSIDHLRVEQAGLHKLKAVDGSIKTKYQPLESCINALDESYQAWNKHLTEGDLSTLRDKIDDLEVALQEVMKPKEGCSIKMIQALRGKDRASIDCLKNMQAQIAKLKTTIKDFAETPANQNHAIHRHH